MFYDYDDAEYDAKWEAEADAGVIAVIDHSCRDPSECYCRRTRMILEEEYDPERHDLPGDTGRGYRGW